MVINSLLPQDPMMLCHQTGGVLLILLVLLRWGGRNLNGRKR